MAQLKVNLKVKPGQSIRAFYLLFIIVGIQIGIGILGAPRYIFENAQQDAWISVIIAFVYMLVVVWAMFVILNQYENADIFGIQVDVFGKWLGKALGSIYILFFFFELLTVVLGYIQIIQIFIFPMIPSFALGLLLLILTTYSVLGGFRVVVGTAFLFTILSPWVFILLYDPITRMETAHFLPVFEASITELLKGARTTSYTFLGLEILFLIYPFIEDKKNAKLPVYIGVSISAFLVLITTIISIGYYSPNDFGLIKWPVLSLFKSVSYSFLERFDYLVLAEWMMVTIPTMTLLMWAITFGTKRLYAIPQKKTLYVTAALILVLCIVINSDVQMNKLNDYINQAGFWIVFVYPFLLLPIVLLKKKVQRSRGSVK